MKKLICAILSFSMMASLVGTAFADSSISDNSSEIIAFSEDTNPLGKVTIRENNNGSLTIYQYNDDKIQSGYIVCPGSGFYEEIDDGVSRVVVTDSQLKAQFNEGRVEPMYVISYEPWGTIRYEDEYAPWEPRLEIDLLMDTVLNPNGEFNLYEEYSNLAELIAFIASFIFGSTLVVKTIAKLIGDSLVNKGLAKILSYGAVQIVSRSLTLDVSITEYYIKAVPGDWSESEGNTKYYEGGAIARVTSNDSAFKNMVFEQDWNENDWRNATFGRILFYDVFGTERHATEWILSS